MPTYLDESSELTQQTYIALLQRQLEKATDHIRALEKVINNGVLDDDEHIGEVSVLPDAMWSIRLSAVKGVLLGKMPQCQHKWSMWMQQIAKPDYRERACFWCGAHEVELGMVPDILRWDNHDDWVWSDD